MLRNSSDASWIRSRICSAESLAPCDLKYPWSLCCSSCSAIAASLRILSLGYFGCPISAGTTTPRPSDPRASWKREEPGPLGPGSQVYPGSDLLSHAVTSAVPSALEGLTSVFGMGTGVAPPATPPGIGWQLYTLILECSQATNNCMSATWSSRTAD